jgi:hypothetical protein
MPATDVTVNQILLMILFIECAHQNIIGIVFATETWVLCIYFAIPYAGIFQNVISPTVVKSVNRPDLSNGPLEIHLPRDAMGQDNQALNITALPSGSAAAPRGSASIASPWRGKQRAR